MMRKTGVILPSQSEPLMRPMIVIGIPGDKRTSGIQQARSDLGMPLPLFYRTLSFYKEDR